MEAQTKDYKKYYNLFLLKVFTMKKVFLLQLYPRGKKKMKAKTITKNEIMYLSFMGNCIKSRRFRLDLALAN